MALKRIVDRVTAEEFLEIVNDPLFIGGLELAINATNIKGYETSFSLSRDPLGKNIYFSDEIDVGDEFSVGGLTERHERLREEFDEFYGERPKTPGVDADPRLLMEWARYEIEFKKFLSEKLDDFKMGFPNLPLERGEMHSRYSEGSPYHLISVHTHPTQFDRDVMYSPVCPSQEDLISLSIDKALTEDGVLLPGGEFIKPSIRAPGLSLIAGTVKLGPSRNRYQLGLVSCHKANSTEREVLYSEGKFMDLWLSESRRGFSTDGNFSFALGEFNPDKKRVYFEPSSLDVLLQVD